jgi:hypothetical protein
MNEVMTPSKLLNCCLSHEARIKDHSDHLKKQQQEGNDFVDVSFTDEPADELTTKTQTESASVSNTNTNTSKRLPENSSPSKSASAAQRYYQKNLNQ